MHPTNNKTMKLFEFKAILEDRANAFVKKFNERDFNKKMYDALIENGGGGYVATIEDVDIRDHERGLEFCIEREYNGKTIFVYGVAEGIESTDGYAFESYEQTDIEEVIFD